MSVIFDDTHKIFKLDAKNTTYSFMIQEMGYLIHLYYGAHISDTDLIYTIGKRVNASFSAYPAESKDDMFSLDTQLQEYSGCQTGDFRLSSVAVTDENGYMAANLKYQSHVIFSGKKKLKGLPATYVEKDCEATTLEVNLKDEYNGLEVVLSYTVFEDYDVITRNAIIKNSGKQTLMLNKAASACVDMELKDYDLIHFYGCHNEERNTERVQVMHGIQTVASKRGASSHNHNPFLILCEKTTCETAGEAFGFNLVYSGNFSMEIERDYYSQTRLVAGISPENFTWQLRKGEEFVTPELVMAHSSEGFSNISKTLHKLYRTRLCRGPWRDKKRPLLINNWEATMMDFTGDMLVDYAKKAKEAGVEMLVMDDGWFGNRYDDKRALGDWKPNEKKLNGTMKEFVARIKETGLLFGIWFEPEMISPDSDLYRMHPDWCLHMGSRPRSLAREQLVLDMSRKEVREYLKSELYTVLYDSGISYLKWDFNRNLTEVGNESLPPSQQKEITHRFMLGTYEVLEWLHITFPEILVESCSGGGGRFDPGMLYYSQQVWTSDDTDPLERLSIQYGTGFAYPVLTMGAHVSKAPHYPSNRMVSVETRGMVALMGSFGYELNPYTFTEEEFEKVKQLNQLYHKYYDLIHFGDYYRLTDNITNHQRYAWAFVSEDKKECLFFCVVKEYRFFANPLIKLLGLNPNYIYREENSGRCFHGNTLMNVGVSTFSRDMQGDSMLMHFQCVTEK